VGDQKGKEDEVTALRALVEEQERAAAAAYEEFAGKDAPAHVEEVEGKEDWGADNDQGFGENKASGSLHKTCTQSLDSWQDYVENLPKAVVSNMRKRSGPSLNRHSNEDGDAEEDDDVIKGEAKDGGIRIAKDNSVVGEKEHDEDEQKSSEEEERLNEDGDLNEEPKEILDRSAFEGQENEESASAADDDGDEADVGQDSMSSAKGDEEDDDAEGSAIATTAESEGGDSEDGNDDDAQQEELSTATPAPTGSTAKPATDSGEAEARTSSITTPATTAEEATSSNESEQEEGSTTEGEDAPETTESDEGATEGETEAEPETEATGDGANDEPDGEHDSDDDGENPGLEASANASEPPEVTDGAVSLNIGEPLDSSAPADIHMLVNSPFSESSFNPSTGAFGNSFVIPVPPELQGGQGDALSSHFLDLPGEIPPGIKTILGEPDDFHHLGAEEAEPMGEGAGQVGVGAGGGKGDGTLLDGPGRDLDKYFQEEEELPVAPEGNGEGFDEWNPFRVHPPQEEQQQHEQQQKPAFHEPGAGYFDAGGKGVDWGDVVRPKKAPGDSHAQKHSKFELLTQFYSF